MTCSKIFSGDLPELMDEIIQYLRNDISTLYSCILVNRLWCRLTIPLLWEDPFSTPTKNYHFIDIYLQYLEEKDKEKLQDYGINKNLIPLNTLFNYPSFIKYLNTRNIISTIKLWVKAIRNLSNQPSLQSHPKCDLLRFIYESLFKIFIEKETNLNTLDNFIFSNNDHDYFYIAFKLILQNQNFINNIKNLNFTIFITSRINITPLISYLKSINTISSLNYSFYGYHCGFNSKNLNYLFTSLLKNSNISNTLKIITFSNINFNNIFGFNEIFEQLNVLESIHIIDCNYLNSFIQQILNITKPFKLKTLFMNNELPNIDLLILLLKKSGNYLENVNFGLLIKNELKQQSLELIMRYCMKIKVFELFGFDNQNIYLLFNLIENIGQNLNYLSIHQISGSFTSNIETSLIILQNLGQILPFKLGYLDLNLMIENANDFEIFLKNSQNTFINRLCIKIIIREGDDILLYIKEYIMKKKRVKHLSFKVNNNDLFFLKNEVKEFELYNIKVQSYYYFSNTLFVSCIKRKMY
ncbi:hypothetical protein C1646_768622 [Rhizophagus diaphanus]|nr:hypothetical protein C1646_768622 [Rhizophagus diaphanus] [Rhizophagus sp. MUCL 43196]